MHRARVLLALLLLGAGGGRKPLADPSVWEVHTTRVDDRLFRAVKGYAEIYPYLVVEVIQPGQDESEEAVLVGAWSLSEMDGWKIEAAMEGDDIVEPRWRGRDLEFVYRSASGALTCKVTRIGEKRPKVHCREKGGGAARRPGR